MQSGASRRDDDEVARILRAGSDAGPVLAVAEFSPGPWWGFNGVRTVVLTASAVHIQRKRWLGGTAADATTLDLADIRDVTYEVRRRAGHESVRLTLRTGGFPRVFTSKYREALALAEQLHALVADRRDAST